MERSDRKPFQKLEPVTYRNKRWFWGNRSGNHRVLVARPHSGNGGVMVLEKEAYVSIFPATEDGIYSKHHAVRWSHTTPRQVRIRLYAVQIGQARWFGAIKARYGMYEGLTRDESLAPDIHTIRSDEDSTIRDLLSEVYNDLLVISRQGAAGFKLAQATIRSLLDTLPDSMCQHLYPIAEAVC